MDAITVMVVAICITALISWAMQRYELGQIAKIFEQGSRRTQELLEEGNRRTQQLINEGRKEFRELISKMDDRFKAILKAIETHAKTSAEQQ